MNKYINQSIKHLFFSDSKTFKQYTPCPEKSPHYFLNNFNTFKFIFKNNFWHTLLNDTLY